MIKKRVKRQIIDLVEAIGALLLLYVMAYITSEVTTIEGKIFFTFLTLLMAANFIMWVYMFATEDDK